MEKSKESRIQRSQPDDGEREEEGWLLVPLNLSRKQGISVIFVLIAILSIRGLTVFNTKIKIEAKKEPVRDLHTTFVPRKFDYEAKKEPVGDFHTTFVPPKFDYYQPAIRTKFNLPDPTLKESSSDLLVFVLSGRSNFAKRQAIRSSWAKNHSNVFFVIGGPEPGASEAAVQQETQNLLEEQKEHDDLLDSILPDSYRSLPYKVHYMFTWITNLTLGDEDSIQSRNEKRLISFRKNGISKEKKTNIQTRIARQFNWFLKIDDDSIARLAMLERIMLRQYNPNHPIVIGDIGLDLKKARGGKWAEDPHYLPSHYPPWPRGSAGYVVSRSIVKYVGTARNLYYYQGEDAGLGIWLEDAHEYFDNDLTLVASPHFQAFAGCSNELIVIGHDYSADGIVRCYDTIGGDRIPYHKSRIFQQARPTLYHVKVPSR